jgi:hypothetical protein
MNFWPKFLLFKNGLKEKKTNLRNCRQI